MFGNQPATRKLAITSLALLLLMACQQAPAQEPCQGQCDVGQCQGQCQGRCQYCVDGRCFPKRHTFGYYETTWRRWPVPPPTIDFPLTPDPAGLDGGVEVDLDLPASEDENEVIPELPHRRERATGPPRVEEPIEIEAKEPTPQQAEPVKADPFADEIEPFSDAPAEPDEGSTQPVEGSIQPFEGSSTRNMPVQANPYRLSQALTKVDTTNPLRSHNPVPAAVQVGYFPEPANVPAQPPRYPNPLRSRD